MTTRFTETLKWEDMWFRKLKPYEKLLFNFICDKCDIAGFWEIDLELAAYFTGIEQEAILGAFEGLSRGYIKNDKYIWLKNFIQHQRNWPLNPENNAHKAIIARLRNHRDFEKELEKRGFLGAKEPPCKGNSISKGNSKGKGKSKTQENLRIFNEARNLYGGTKNGNEVEFDNFVKKNTDWRDILPKLKPAIEKEIKWREKTNGEFRPTWKNFQTWINKKCWDQELSEPQEPHKETIAEQIVRMKAKGLLKEDTDGHA